MGEHEGTRAGTRAAAKRARTTARGAAGGSRAAAADGRGPAAGGGAPVGRDAPAKARDDATAGRMPVDGRGAPAAGAGRASARDGTTAERRPANARGAAHDTRASAKERGGDAREAGSAHARGVTEAARRSSNGRGAAGGGAGGSSARRRGAGVASNAAAGAGGGRWPADDDWCALLIGARRRVRVSREALAEASGVSAATVRAYETGRRRPRREPLEQLLFHLNIPFDEANAILEAAGFAPRRTRFTPQTHPHYYYAQDELQEIIDAAPWPEFVMNDSTEVIATNAAVDALWGIDFAHERRVRTSVQRNILSVASDNRFAEHVVNWEECVAAMATVLKTRPQSLDEPNPYFDAVLAEFAQGDPAYLTRLAEVWAKTPAHDSRVVWHYRVVWRDDEYGEMRFLATVAPASEPDGTGFNSWHPVDADSWSVLESVKARREGMAPARPASRRSRRRQRRRVR